MKNIKYFNQLNDYTSNKDSFEYPTVSYVEENTNVYYVNPPASFINLHYEIKDNEQLQMINSVASYFSNKLPLLMRSDLIQEAKLDGVDITSQLHQGEPYVFTATTVKDKLNEYNSLLTNESGVTDYVIATDGPFEVGSSWDLEIKFKDGITDCFGLFTSSLALSEIPENIFNDCTYVTDFSYTFSYCSGLTGNIPENLFKYNTAVTSFQSTFESCTGLAGIIPANLFSNNTEVTDFTYTFSYCSGLTGDVPVDNDGTPIYNRSGSGKLGYAIVTSHDRCFQICTGLTDYDSIPNDWKYSLI